MHFGSARFKLMLAATLALVLAGCAQTPPRNPHNSCAILEEKGGWYDATMDSYEKWGVPVHVQLAIMYQESSFRHDAKTPRTKLLWVIPWKRQSSAYGFAQVKDETWDWYKKKTGNWGADRDDFRDAADFIGWYGSMSQRLAGISKWDARNQYLAYHEGHGGYKRKTYAKKAWLVKVADKVDRRARDYRAQLGQCRDELKRGWFF